MADDWDPLGVLAASSADAPQPVAAAPPAVVPRPIVSVSSASSSSSSKSFPRSPYLDWPARRGAILREFTLLGGKLTVSGSSFGGGDDSSGDGAGEAQQVSLAKARQRLEALEAASKGLLTLEMSESQYAERVKTMATALANAWASGHRVASLKIAIQAAKLLSSSSPGGGSSSGRSGAASAAAAFYPSSFALATEVLDTFGSLVFARLKAIGDDEYRRTHSPSPLSSGSGAGGSGAGAKKGAGAQAALPPGLPDNFIAADVGGEARETARNWLYKTACIRELLPRLFVEMALLPCYRFLFDVEFGPLLMRLAEAIRGIGDPLVASFARLYLCRTAAVLLQDDPDKQRESALACLGDFLLTFKTSVLPIANPPPAPAAGAGGVSDSSGGKSRRAAEKLLQQQAQQQTLSAEQYLRLFSPSVSWQMHQCGWLAGRDTFLSVLQSYRQHCGSSFVLQSILEAFDPSFYSGHTADILALIKDAAPSFVTTSDLLVTLAGRLAADRKALPPAEQRRVLEETFLEALPTISVKDDAGFLKAATTFLDFFLAYSGQARVLRLLELIGARLNRVRANHQQQQQLGDDAGTATTAAPTGSAASSATGLTESCMQPLEALIRALVNSGQHELVRSEHFTTLLDALQSEMKPGLARWALTTLLAPNASPASASAAASTGSITGDASSSFALRFSDPTFIGILQELGKTCHDSLDPMSSKEDHRAVGSLLASLVRSIDLGRDLERQLALFVESRQYFGDSDEVSIALVTSGVALINKALGFVGGNASRYTSATASFVRAAVAFVTITIPSVSDPVRRISLDVAAARAALTSGCIGQADALFKAAIQELADLTSPSPASGGAASGSAEAGGSPDTDEAVLRVVQECAAAAVPMPGHPDQGGFYIARGLLNAVTSRYHWAEGEKSPHRGLALLAVAAMVSALKQFPLPCLAFPSLYEKPRLTPSAEPLVAGVLSNADLYAGHEGYEEEARELLASVSEKLGQVKAALASGAIASRDLPRRRAADALAALLKGAGDGTEGN